MALLLFLLRRRKDLAIEVLATHVNHGIRGASARADANFVTAFCRRNGVELFLYDAEKEGVPIPPQPSEEWARGAALYLVRPAGRAREEALIATAHTCSDQAETLLFRMARGDRPARAGRYPALPRHLPPPLLVPDPRRYRGILCRPWAKLCAG